MKVPLSARLALLGLLLPAAGALAAPETSPVPGMVLVSTNQLAAIEKEGDTLRHENELLRKENRALRRQLVKKNQALERAERPAPAQGAEEDGRWLSSSGKRHNARCRYFKQGAGKPCGKDEGVPCKICGG